MISRTVRPFAINNPAHIIEGRGIAVMIRDDGAIICRSVCATRTGGVFNQIVILCCIHIILCRAIRVGGAVNR